MDYFEKAKEITKEHVATINTNTKQLDSKTTVEYNGHGFMLTFGEKQIYLTPKMFIELQNFVLAKMVVSGEKIIMENL